MLGGNNFFRTDKGEILREIDEIKRFGAKNIFAIIDSEKKTATDELSNARKCFVEACTQLKISVLVTEKRATENYITDHAVKKVRTGLNALSEYEELKQWNKNENWKMFNQMSKEEFDKTDIGKFIEKQLIPSTR